MKNLLFIALTLTAFSCRQRTIHDVNDVNTTIINKIIIDYFSKEFQKVKSTEPQAQFKIDTTTSGIEVYIITDANSIIDVSHNIIPFSTKYIKVI